MENLLYWVLTQGGCLQSWGWVHPQVSRDLRAALEQMQQKRTRKAEQELLAQSIEAFEEWQRKYPTFQNEPIILEKLARALEEIQ